MEFPKTYVQVRFELIYGSEISYLTVHLHEKARKDASLDMTLEHSKQEIKKVMVGHEKDAHFRQEEEDDYQNNIGCTWKTLEKG